MGDHSLSHIGGKFPLHFPPSPSQFSPSSISSWGFLPSLPLGCSLHLCSGIASLASGVCDSDRQCVCGMPASSHIWCAGWLVCAWADRWAGRRRHSCLSWNRHNHCLLAHLHPDIPFSCIDIWWPGGDSGGPFPLPPSLPPSLKNKTQAQASLIFLHLPAHPIPAHLHALSPTTPHHTCLHTGEGTPGNLSPVFCSVRRGVQCVGLVSLQWRAWPAQWASPWRRLPQLKQGGDHVMPCHIKCHLFSPAASTWHLTRHDAYC